MSADNEQQLSAIDHHVKTVNALLIARHHLKMIRSELEHKIFKTTEVFDVLARILAIALIGLNESDS